MRKTKFFAIIYVPCKYKAFQITEPTSTNISTFQSVVLFYHTFIQKDNKTVHRLISHTGLWIDEQQTCYIALINVNISHLSPDVVITYVIKSII